MVPSVALLFLLTQAAPANAVADRAGSSEEAETVVSAERLPRPLSDIPSTVWVLPQKELRTSPASTFDNLVRTVPSVATFRRSSSLTADPTSQGLNLRGLGPSGVSRGLVLQDGIPLNDPFGGWVYWQALSRLDTERIEIAPTGASALYGNFALGGVMQAISRNFSPHLDAELSAGRFGTLNASARAATTVGSWGGAVFGEYLGTNGYNTVLPAERGAIDGPAASRHGTIGARLQTTVRENLTLSARGTFFDEEENGGTQLTTSQVRMGSYGAGARLEANHGTWEMRFFGGVQHFSQKRARIPPDRNTEALSAVQQVPASNQGASLTWTSPELDGGGKHLLLVGADAMRVVGFSTETLYPVVLGNSTIVGRRAGGEQLFLGLFAQDALRFGRVLQLTAAGRVDVWSNRSGERSTSQQDGAHRTTPFAPRSDVQWSPKVGVRYAPLSSLSFKASGYRAFRAPTLNELYRPFQVGTILTGANEALLAETLWGAEAGPELTFKQVSLRLSGFANVLTNPITNVTLNQPLPDGASRQRQNLGRARVRGLELELDWRLSRRWTTLLAYTYVEPTVMSAPAHPELVGKILAQDPRHRASLSLRLDDPRFLTAVAQARWNGPQFEDDQNALPMSGFVVVDVFLERQLVWGFQVFAAAENLFNRTYLVGRSGVNTIGQPLSVRFGLKLEQ